MSEKKFLKENNSRMKLIQNEIKEIIIEKLLLKIMNQNKEIIKLKEKCEYLEKLSINCLKKLLNKKNKNNEKKNINLSPYFSPRDITFNSDVDSINLINNFCPLIECKKIIFKKKETFSNEIIKNNNNKNDFLIKFKSPEINSSYVKKQNKNLINCLSDINKKKTNKKNNKNFFMEISETKKSKEKIKNNNNSTKKLINLNNISNDNNNILNKNNYLNNKIKHSSSSKNYLNNSIEKQKKNIKTLSYNENYNIHSRHLKKKQSKNYLNTENLFFSKSPQTMRNNLINDFRNSSIVKITLSPENL